MSSLRALAFSIALVGALPAAAQHPLPPRNRPLHERIAAADVVAVGTIAAIQEGRIEVRDAAVLRGGAPASFEIKRNPANPPPFAAGVPAVLLLRGARPPYVLVDEPREVIVPSDTAAARRWADALRALFAAEGDPGKLLHTYLVWLDGDDATLGEAAGAALADPQASYLPLDREDALERARAALDPTRTPSARRVSAGLAATELDGATALATGVPGDAPDALVVAIALRGTPALARELRLAALLRSLASSEPSVRRAALMVAPTLWSDAVAAQVKELAASDPDSEVKSDAQAALSRSGGM